MRTKSRRKKGILLALAANGLLLFAVGVHAATLADYDARLSRVITLIAAIQNPSTGHSGSEPAAPANLDFVSESLPAKDSVVFRGQTIAVDNSWLEGELNEYKRFTKASDRNEAVARIIERLRAIQEKVHELDAAASQPADKDADKGRLAAILRRPEYLPKPPESNALERLLVRFLRWLEKLMPRLKPVHPGNLSWISRIVQIIVIAVCLGAIAYLIWRFGPRLVRGRRKKKKKREARIVLGERLEPDQTSADLLTQAEGLARDGNLRAAIRKAYIALLCELGDRKIISLAQYKTNRDYLNAVRDKGSLYPSMRKLTNMFELHWYGFVPAGESEWDEFRTGYKKIFRSDQ
ncbi:MAG TPA: DUF4129 domain-containing protein [Pyrinomonadaceae bacterium]|nr:DUF4129 domain-containing protein [Pyrinomonadaceae bacterium]